MIGKREIGTEKRLPPVSETRTRDEKPVRDWTLAGKGRGVEVEFSTTGDHVGLGAGFVQESSEISRGGTSTDHRHRAATELTYFRMLRTVREKFFRQPGKDGRDIAEVRDAYSDDDTTSGENLSCLRRQDESV